MSSAPSYAQAEQRIQHEYQHLLEAGKVTPASSLIGSLNFIVLISWLLVCGSLSDATFRRSRVPVFITIAAISVWNLLYVRSIGVVGSIGVGLNSALCTILATNFVLIHDPRRFKRLVLRPFKGVFAANEPAHLNGTVLNGGGQDSEYVLAWQSMPPTFWSRLVWIFDLITSFRDVHWSWGPVTSSSPISKQQWLASMKLSRGGSLVHNSTRFLADYLLIDLVKCIMITDPYFIGYARAESPPHIAPYITSSLGLHAYRTLLATVGVWVAIDLIFSFVVLLQVNMLGRSVLGLNALPIAFPALWGSFGAVSRKGLRGFWGETWHQIFRMHFLSVGSAIASILLPHKDSPRDKTTSRDKMLGPHSRSSTTRFIIRTATAFLLSGVVHACASYTLLGPTTPWKPFVFFMTQPVGMTLQAISSLLFARCSFLGMSVRAREVTCRLSNQIVTFGWLWASAGIFLDDVTSGGIWMFEPIPVSFIRGLGFSRADNRLWCW